MQDKYDTSVSEVELLILLLVAVVTSAITAVVGAGGGLILLIVILQFVDPLARCVHAVIQLFANSTRAVTLRGEADWEVLRPYLAPVLPVSVAGYLLADGVPEDGGRAVIGVLRSWRCGGRRRQAGWRRRLARSSLRPRRCLNGLCSRRSGRRAHCCHRRSRPRPVTIPPSSPPSPSPRCSIIRRRSSSLVCRPRLVRARRDDDRRHHRRGRRNSHRVAVDASSRRSAPRWSLCGCGYRRSAPAAAWLGSVAQERSDTAVGAAPAASQNSIKIERSRPVGLASSRPTVRCRVTDQ